MSHNSGKNILEPSSKVGMHVERPNQSACRQDGAVLPDSQDGAMLPNNQDGAMLPNSQDGAMLPNSQDGAMLRNIPTVHYDKIVCNQLACKEDSLPGNRQQRQTTSRHAGGRL